MKVKFGYDFFELKKNSNKVPIIWDSEKAINSHFLVVGSSGVGKTYQLRKLINNLKSQNKDIRIHIFDFHNDIQIDGASSVKFSESTNCGYNPLVINPDPDFGGVRKNIQSFILSLNKTGRVLGSKQEAALRNLLIDLYAANGFYLDKSESWVLNDGIKRQYPKKYPTLNDALKFSNFKLHALFLGSNNKTMALLEQLNRSASRLYSKQKSFKKAYTQEDIETAKQAVEDLKDKCIEQFTDYVKSIETGSELNELMKYDSKDVLKSVVERLDNLNSMGIFKDKKPPFDDNCNVWRYEINSLLLEEKKLFVDLVMEQIFARRVQEGETRDVKEIILIDEAHNFFTDDGEHIINRIAKEARKFGLGLICASQSPTHFSEDFMTNVGCKIILGIDESYWMQTEKKLNIASKALSFITPQQNMLIQIKNKMQNKSLFKVCSLVE